jgi:Na+-transporting methylmalonyl-CoA/oxaloacetate decarboxylase gamma subunit
VTLVAGVGLVFVVLLLATTLWYARRLMKARA